MRVSPTDTMDRPYETIDSPIRKYESPRITPEIVSMVERSLLGTA